MPPHNYGYGRQHSPEEDLTDADRFAPHNNSSSNGTLIRSNMRKQHRDVRNKRLSSSLNTASTDSTAANILMERVMASGRRGSLSIEDEFPDANNHLKDHAALNQHDRPPSPPHSQAVQETFHKYKEIYEAMLQGVFDDLDDLDCKLVHHNRSDGSSTTAEVTPSSSPVVDEKEVNVNEDAIVVVDRRQQRDKKRDPPTTSSSASIDSADADDATPTPIEDRGVDPPTTTALTLTTAYDAENSMISDSDDRSKTLADLVADFHELQDIQSQDALSNDDLQSHDVMSLISSKFHHQKDDKRRGEDLKEEEGNNEKEKKKEEEDALVLVEKKTANMKEKENALVPVDKKKSSSNDRGRQRKSRRPSTGKEQSNSSEDVKKSHHQGSKPSSPRKSSRSPHHGRRRTRSPSPTPPNNNGEEKGAARVSRSKSPFDMLRSISPFGRSTQEDASSSSRYRGRSLSLSWTSNAETTGDEKKSAKLLRKMKSFASSSLKILPSAGSGNSLHKFRVGDMAKYKISSRVRNLDGLDVFTEGDDKLCIVRILEVGEDGVLELPLYKILLPNGTKRKTNSKFLSACSKQQAKESSHLFRYEEESRRRSRSSSNRRSSSRSSSRRRSRSQSAESSPSCLSSSSHHSSSNNNNRRSRSSSSRRSSSSSRRSPSPYEKKNSCSGRDRSSSRSKQRKNKSDGDHLTGKSSFGESEVTAKTTNKRRK